MTPAEIKTKSDELQAEMNQSLNNVRRQLKTYDIFFYVIKITTLALAALVAFEPVFRVHLKSGFLTSELFWDACGLLVLLLLLLDLGLRPDEKRQEKLHYIGRTEVLVKSISFVDPDSADALEKLEQINRSR